MIGATMNGAVSSDNAPRQLVPESVGMRNEVFLLTFGDVDKSSSVDSASSTYLELSDGISTVVTAETLEPDDDCSEVTVSDSPTRDDSTDRRCHFTVPSDLALDRKRSDSVYTPTVSNEDDELARSGAEVNLIRRWKNTFTTLWTKHRRSALTGIVIAVVWVLILLPAISYHVPGLQSEATTSSNDNGASNASHALITNISIPVCSDGFYLQDINLNNSTTVKICRPECGKWEEFPHSTVVVLKGLQMTGSCLYILGGTIVLAISVVLHQRMFKLPSIFIIYLTVSLGILKVFSLVSHIWGSLFCSSLDLVDSIDHPSTYCIVAGVMQYYITIQAELLWLFHTVMIFWGIQFPFHRQKIISAGYRKYIHLTMVLCVLLIPAALAGIPFATGGYSPKRFPPDTCHAADSVTIYYVYMLPSAVVSVIGVSLLVIVFQTIISHMQRGSRHRRRRSTITLNLPSLSSLILSNSARRQSVLSQQEQLKIGAAEIKITIICLYFLLFLLTIQVALAVGLRTRHTFQADLTDYFSCEATGQTPGKNCEKSFGRLEKDIIETTANFLIGFLPFVYLFHVVNIDELKAKFRRLCSCRPRGL